jgi:hypothetical protein
MSRCLSSFVTRACPSRPFYALRATPKTALNFGWLVGWLVTGKSHKHHVASSVSAPGPAPFPTLLCPAGHPENSLQFWSVGQSVGRSVTGKSHKHHSASSVSSPGPALPDPSTPCWATPKTALNFGWLVGWLVGRSVGRSVTEKSHERHAASSVSAPRLALPDPSPPCGPPQNSLKFWLVGRSVSRSVTRKSQERHAAYSVLSPGPALPDPSTPCTPPPKDLKFWSIGRSVGRLVGWSVGRLVGQSLRRKSHERHAASLVSSPRPTFPDPSTPCGTPPKRR